MRNFLVVTVCALSIAVAAESGAQTQGPVPNAFAPEISASARGEVRQAADRAWINFTVETRDGSASTAGSLNSQRTSVLLEALKNAGVPQADIVTSGYSVSQNYESEGNRTPRPAGFIARNSIRVTVSQLEKVGRVIDAGLGGGATQVTTMQLGPVDSNDARRRALALGVADARRDAEVMATAAGGSLGRLISLSSSFASSPVMGREMMNEVVLTSAAGYAGPTPFSPREITISAIAYGRWEFIPASK